MLENSSLFKQKGFSAHHCHFLSSVLSESLRPFHFSRVPFPVEVSMAFWSAKFERLRIIANKRYSVPRINWTRAEIAITNSHFLIDTWLQQGIRSRRRSAEVGVADVSNCVLKLMHKKAMFLENSIDSIGGIGGERFAVRFQTIRTFVHTHLREIRCTYCSGLPPNCQTPVHRKSGVHRKIGRVFIFLRVTGHRWLLFFLTGRKKKKPFLHSNLYREDVFRFNELD